MGLMDLKGKVNKTLFGNDVDSFSQGIRETRESDAIFEYEMIAMFSFENPDYARRRLDKWIKKRSKKSEIILDYFNGQTIYQPPFVEEWLRLQNGTEEDMEKAIANYEKEHNCSVKHYVEGYENFVEWCADENGSYDTSKSMLPICFNCGAVITVFDSKCPCCGNIFDDEECEENEVGTSENNFCSNCGAKMETDSRFCPNCGNALR